MFFGKLKGAKEKKKYRELTVNGSVKSLFVELDAEAFRVDYGSEFKVFTNDDTVALEEKDGIVRIFNSAPNENGSSLEVKILMPLTMKLEEFDAKVKYGAITLGNVKAAKYNVSLENGNMDIFVLQNDVDEEVKLNVSSGSINIREGKVNNLEASFENGSIDFTGALYGRNVLRGTLGTINVKSTRELKKLTIKAKSEEGMVGFDGRRSQMINMKGGEDTLDANLQKGNIVISYIEEDSRR